MTRALWYWVDRTRRFPRQERMPDARLLARTCIEQGLRLNYVRWDVRTAWLAAPSDPELADLPQNVPSGDNKPMREFDGAWLLIPEALVYLGAPDTRELISSATRHGLRTVFLYGDLLAADGLLPDEEEAAARYAMALADADLVLCSNQASLDRLLKVLCSSAQRTAGLELRCHVVPFPAADQTPSAFCAAILRLLTERGGERSLIGHSIPRAVPNDAKRFRKPVLSLCITTYNRAGWLRHSLFAALQVTAALADIVEVLVVDNASTDETADVVRSHIDSPNLRYVRNAANVGMLGNLKVTANEARGEYVWVIGDDDIPIPGAVERILWAIATLGDVPLIYLNYAYTQIDRPERLADLKAVFAKAVPISHEFRDEYTDEVRHIAAKTENCFTAIYCCVFRRDHAVKAYSMDTSGEPFSSLRSCVPSAVHVVNELFHGPALWLGEPCVVVNMQVSWADYAPQFVLERLPELYDLMEARGASRKLMDAIRQRSVPNVVNFMRRALAGERPSGDGISLERLIRRYKHFGDFEATLKHGFIRADTQDLFQKYGLNVPKG